MLLRINSVLTRESLVKTSKNSLINMTKRHSYWLLKVTEITWYSLLKNLIEATGEQQLTIFSKLN